MRAIWRWLVHAYHRIVDATPGGAVGLLVIIAAIAGVALIFAQRRGVSGRRRGDDPVASTFRPMSPPSSSGPRPTRWRPGANGPRRCGHAFGPSSAASRSAASSIPVRGAPRRRSPPKPAPYALTFARACGKGAQTFGEIWYGRRAATAADDASLRELDTALRARAPRDLVDAAQGGGYVAAPR